MKKIFSFVLMLCMTTMSSFAIDWSSYEWLGDGAGGGLYSNKYKMTLADGQGVVNIQKPGFAAEAGIYTTFPAGVSECSLGEGKYAIQGAGMVLYLSAFTAKETDVTVKAGDKDYAFVVYYEDGTASQGEDTEYTITVVQPTAGGTIAADKAKATYRTTITLTATPAAGKMLDKWEVKDAENNVITVKKDKFDMPKSNVTVTATFKDYVEIKPATYYGREEKEVATFNWSITRNADQTLTFAIAWDKDLEGAAPQVTVGSLQFARMTDGEKSATYTTADTFEDGTQPTIFFYVAYAGGAARIDVNYTVGAENEKPDTTAIDVVKEGTRARKVVENGVVYVVRDGAKYNILGTRL